MRIVISFFMCVVLLLSSCGKVHNYSICGYAPNDGDTIVLAFSSNGAELERVASCVVRNGKFSFNGDVEGCKIGYIYNSNGGMCSLFFIEPGCIEMQVDSLSCRAWGTYFNDLNNSVKDSIDHYVAALDEIEEQFCSQALDVAEMVRLGCRGYNVQNGVIAFLRRTVNENIGNLFGLYMLVAYSDLFNAQEYSFLVERVPQSCIDRENNPFYDIALDILSVRSAEAVNGLR